MVIFNSSLKKIVRTSAISTFEKEIYTMSIMSKWSQFEKLILEKLWMGKHLQGPTVDLKKHIYDSVHFQFLDDLITFLKEDKEKKIKNLFSAIVQQSLSLHDIILDIHIEKSNELELKLESLVEKKEEKQEQETEETTEESEETESYIKPGEAVLDANLVISPVKGEPINELQVGDFIMLRLDEKSPSGKYFINLLNVKKGKKILPVPAKIRYIEYDDTIGYTVISEIGPNVISRSIEQEQVKILTSDDFKLQEKRFTFKATTWIIGGLVVLIILLLLIFFIFKPL